MIEGTLLGDEEGPCVKTIVVYGGINGLGKIIADQAEEYGHIVYRTGRNPTIIQLKSKKYFDL